MAYIIIKDEIGIQIPGIGMQPAGTGTYRI